LAPDIKRHLKLRPSSFDLFGRYLTNKYSVLSEIEFTALDKAVMYCFKKPQLNIIY